MKVSDVRSGLNKLVNAVHRNETRVLVEKSGIPVAGLVSPRDLERLARLDEDDRQAWSIVDEIREAFKDVPAAELEREGERAIAAVRAERRAEHEQTAARA
jgi:PHD/YefM family antitoxin component YafN of YafNO toxin-antitoxin module